ncbi:MAG: hypothetical protein ABJG68_17515 [Crocinitomicaceae bacterium]
MSKVKFILRLTAITALMAIFAYGAVYLYKKQQAQINYLSFQISEDATSYLVGDLDKLKSKSDVNTILEEFQLDSSYAEGIQPILNADLSFADYDLNSCFFSFDHNSFLVALKTDVGFHELVNFLNDQLNVECQLSNNVLTVGKTSLQLSKREKYLLLTSVEFEPKATKEIVDYTSADVIEYSSTYPIGKKHILSNQMHYQVWTEKGDGLKGKAVSSEPFFALVPPSFDEATFYGSSRMLEDVPVVFNQPSEGSFDWLGDGLLYFAKDSFELIIARPSAERDLELILEEQTLAFQADSLQVPYFNIGKFKVLPFKTAFNWSESISELDSELSYYTEYNNFNVLANSIPAMRWYLSQVQLGNLLEGNDESLRLYQKTAPTISHKVIIEKNTDLYSCRSEIYQKNANKLVSLVNLNTGLSTASGVEVIHEFTIDFTVENIQLVETGGEVKVLLSNAKTVALYTKKGEQLWKRVLQSSLVQLPQIVDFENDGKKELVFFQTNGFDVVNDNGKSRNGYPVSLGAESKVGLAVNYDNQFVYRIIVNSGNKVLVYSEEGKIVDGWMFEGMTSPIKSKIYHVLTAGKDIIAFKDVNNNQYILNRRGESRLSNPVAFGLQNETDFVVGGMETSLRKMGYSNGYILNYYVLDGERDSVKIDQNVAPIAVHWEYNTGNPLLIIEESSRLLIVDQFGYVKSEVLKPSQTNNFVGLVGTKEYGFVFSDISENTIYLLNNYGKMMLPNSVQGSSVCTIQGDLLYTISGVTLKAYKIKN